MVMHCLNKIYVLSLITLLVSVACGFQFRGATVDALKGSGIYVQSANADMLAKQVKQKLLEYEVTTVNNRSDADYVITLRDESYDKEVLFVSPSSGKVLEYELSYSVAFEISTVNGAVEIVSDRISVTRSYIFDETSILGKSREELKLQQGLVTQAAASLIRQIKVVIQ